MNSSMVALGELTKIRTGKLDANAANHNGAYPFFTCAVEPLSINTAAFDCKAVLVAGNGDLNVKYYEGKFNAYQRTYVIESLDESKLHPKYLYLYLDKYVAKLREQAIGGVIKYIKLENLTNAKIPLPSLAEQKRIAAILNKAAEIKVKREQAIANLDELVKSTFGEMFGDRKTNRKKYTVKKLNELAVITSGSTPRRSATGYMNGTIPWVKTTEVDGNEIHDTEEKLTEEGLSSIGNKLNPIDSIIVAMYGQGKTRGRVGLLKNIAATNQACGVIRPSKLFLPGFMFWQLHLSYEELRALGRGGNQENLNLQLLGAFEVLVPPFNEQEKFSSFANKLLEHKKRMQRFESKVLDTIASLQHQAFTAGFNQ